MLLSNNRLLACAFISGNALDWFLTRRLIDTGGGYEANPIAAQILQTHGWFGLALLKLFSVALVVCVLIARMKPKAGRRLLRFGCGLLVVVVGYSTLVLMQAQADQEILRKAKSLGAQLDWQRRRALVNEPRTHRRPFRAMPTPWKTTQNSAVRFWRQAQ
jgi:hypothetical protein